MSTRHKLTAITSVALLLNVKLRPLNPGFAIAFTYAGLALSAFGLDASTATTVTPRPTHEVLLNPGKGWVLYGMPEWQVPAAMVMGNIGYERFQWADLEPVEGEFNWKQLEDALAGWDKAGKQFAFGVMCASSHSKSPYVTPKWVFDAGAKHRLIDLNTLANPYAGVPGQKAVPEFYDPVFLAKLKNFLNAMGRRFDGDPRIAFIDIRSYGNWGEGHMYPFGGKGLTSDEFKHHIRMHLDSFKKTRLCVSAEGREHSGVYDWAVQQGVAARRDGICGNSDGFETVRAFGHAPGVFEFYGAYSWMKEKGWWEGKKDKDGNGYKLVDCVENGRPSYIGLSQGGKEESLKFLAAECHLIEQLANHMGYHFVLKEASYPSTVVLNTSVVVKLTWSNEGVAPVYVPCAVALALLDAEDQPVDLCWPAGQVFLPAGGSVMPSSTGPGSWMPGKSVAEEVKVSFTKAKPGGYRLAVGLVQRTGSEKPWIKLGIENRTEGGWYPLGQLQVRQEFK
ncbi:MAG: DUF4832 domain-containing protein [bacterium]